MELRHLVYFGKVAELGSFSKAAAVLHMTQPSLSRQIVALERELGYPLLTRTSRGVVPTSAGIGLQRHLEVVFAQVERVPEVVRTGDQGKELIRIGLPPGLPDAWALALFASVEDLLPSVRLSLYEATTDEQRQLLQNSLIDLGLIHLAAPELRSVEVFAQRIGVAVPHDSPLAHQPEANLTQLDELQVLAHAAGEINVEESRLRSALVAAGVHTDWVFRRFSEYSELIAITSGVDAVFLTEASAARHLPGWKWVPISGAGVDGLDLRIRTWAAWREPSRPYVTEVVDIMKTLRAIHLTRLGWGLGAGGGVSAGGGRALSTVYRGVPVLVRDRCRLSGLSGVAALA